MVTDRHQATTLNCFQIGTMAMAGSLTYGIVLYISYDHDALVILETNDLELRPWHLALTLNIRVEFHEKRTCAFQEITRIVTNERSLDASVTRC